MCYSICVREVFYSYFMRKADINMKYSEEKIQASQVKCTFSDCLTKPSLSSCPLQWLFMYRETEKYMTLLYIYKWRREMKNDNILVTLLENERNIFLISSSPTAAYKRLLFRLAYEAAKAQKARSLRKPTSNAKLATSWRPERAKKWRPYEEALSETATMHLLKPAFRRPEAKAGYKAKAGSAICGGGQLKKYCFSAKYNYNLMNEAGVLIEEKKCVKACWKSQ